MEIHSPDQPLAADMADRTEEGSGAHFFDLPQEVRDMIYSSSRRLAWIDITQSHPYPRSHPPSQRLVDGRLVNTTNHPELPENDKSVAQPNYSKVCRRMRSESLDIFYGRNKFLLDLRPPWKHVDYPRRWTPVMIFEHWIDAIGDASAARLRSLSFWSYNFAAHIKISNDLSPKISLKFRPASIRMELAENVPCSYTFQVAVKRAERGLRGVLDEIEALRVGQRLTARDLKRIAKMVESCQPFLCSRANLGGHGAILPSVDAANWPRPLVHLDKCDDCGYHRYLRGED
jgi:hypothetical protein